jgi:hypothetical protein
MPNCAAIAANTSDQTNEETPGNAAFQGFAAADVVPATLVNALGTWEFRGCCKGTDRIRQGYSAEMV